jgi:hypothetical protein
MPNIPSNVQVSNPLTATSLIISWSANKDVVTGYNVYRALAKEGVFTLLMNLVGTSYVDTTAQQRSHTLYWYRVTALNGIVEGSPSEAVSNVVVARDDSNLNLPRAGDLIEQNQKAILSEIVRRDDLLLRRGGEFVNVFIRKTVGPKCTTCYSPARNQPTNPNCPMCLGTTYIGGYDKYANVLLKIKPITTKLELMEMGLKVSSSPQAWFGTYPIVSDGDIVVRIFNNKRYEIQSKEEIISRGILVRQQFTINEILPTQQPVLFTLS